MITQIAGHTLKFEYVGEGCNNSNLLNGTLKNEIVLPLCTIVEEWKYRYCTQRSSESSSSKMGGPVITFSLTVTS